jgi:hypothetical protein
LGTEDQLDAVALTLHCHTLAALVKMRDRFVVLLPMVFKGQSQGLAVSIQFHIAAITSSEKLRSASWEWHPKDCLKIESTYLLTVVDMAFRTP